MGVLYVDSGILSVLLKDLWKWWVCRRELVSCLAIKCCSNACGFGEAIFGIRTFLHMVKYELLCSEFQSGLNSKAVDNSLRE